MRRKFLATLENSVKTELNLAGTGLVRSSTNGRPFQVQAPLLLLLLRPSLKWLPVEEATDYANYLRSEGALVIDIAKISITIFHHTHTHTKRTLPFLRSK